MILQIYFFPLFNQYLHITSSANQIPFMKMLYISHTYAVNKTSIIASMQDITTSDKHAEKK